MTTLTTVKMVTTFGYVGYLDRRKQISSKFVKNRRQCLVGLCVIIFRKTKKKKKKLATSIFYSFQPITYTVPYHGVHPVQVYKCTFLSSCTVFFAGY